MINQDSVLRHSARSPGSSPGLWAAPRVTGAGSRLGGLCLSVLTRNKSRSSRTLAGLHPPLSCLRFLGTWPSTVPSDASPCVNV